MARKFVGGGKEKSLERPGLGHEIADQRRVACREKEIARRHELAGLQIASDVKNRFAFAHREGLLINLPADDFPENVASRHGMVEEIFARPQRASGMTPRIDLERQLAANDAILLQQIADKPRRSPVGNLDEHSFFGKILVWLRNAVPHPRRVAARRQNDQQDQIEEIFQSRLAFTFRMRISTLFRRLRLALEIFIQDHGGGYGIHGGSFPPFSRHPAAALLGSMEKSSLRFFEQTFRFPARQPLINHFPPPRPAASEHAAQSARLLPPFRRASRPD